ncbi:MAG TPA: hypothetical protein VL172_10755, partial [Kofleriaceae bacterium]|nr:hypothetical protein [Kofleriaceae bacterium]
YDGDGAMVGETVTSGDGSVRSQRSRVLAGGQVVRDTRVLRDAAGQRITELDFARDAAGRVIARDYTVDGVAADRHTWTYDGGDIVRHQIARPDLAAPIVHQRAFSADRRTIAILRDGVLTESRTVDAAGRLTGRTYPGGATDTYIYDVAGALAAYEQRWDGTGEPEMRLAYQRRPDGLVTERRWAYPGIADTDTFVYACE